MPSLAAMFPVEATLRFRVRAIFLTGVLFFASPRSLCLSAAVHALSSVGSDRSLPLALSVCVTFRQLCLYPRLVEQLRLGILVTVQQWLGHRVDVVWVD